MDYYVVICQVQMASVAEKALYMLQSAILTKHRLNVPKSYWINPTHTVKSDTATIWHLLNISEGTVYGLQQWNEFGSFLSKTCWGQHTVRLFKFYLLRVKNQPQKSHLSTSTSTFAPWIAIEYPLKSFDHTASNFNKVRMRVSSCKSHLGSWEPHFNFICLGKAFHWGWRKKSACFLGGERIS